VTRERTKLHNEEFNDIILLTKYCTGNKIENEMGGACSPYGELESRIEVFGGKPEGKRTIKRPRYRWEDILR
jgi:hypothetical protein